MCVYVYMHAYVWLIVLSYLHFIIKPVAVAKSVERVQFSVESNQWLLKFILVAS